MDSRVWREYLHDVVKPEIDEPSVLLVDNLDSHVSEESYEIVCGELFSQLCSLPPNSTSVAQPLDVGVMGPLKKKLRAAWLTEERERKPTAAQKRSIMIHRTIKMFDELSVDSIQSSFAKALPVANV